MRKALALLLFLFLFSMTFAEFKLESVDVVVSNINKEGSARVTEHIKVFVIGAYEQEKYKNGISNNNLATWATLTGISEVKIHMSGTQSDIQNFGLRPQTLSKCDPFMDLCHGELIITYDIYPYFNKTTGEVVPDTGLFSIDNYKPRTTKYTLNTKALNFRRPQTTQKNDTAFTAASENVIFLDKNIHLTILLPQSTVILDLSQSPENMQITPPTAAVSELTWTNTVLGQFVLIVEVEESLDKEVVDFFSNIPKKVQQIIFGNQGLAIILIIVIIIGSVIYLKSLEKK